MLVKKEVPTPNEEEEVPPTEEPREPHQLEEEQAEKENPIYGDDVLMPQEEIPTQVQPSVEEKSPSPHDVEEVSKTQWYETTANKSVLDILEDSTSESEEEDEIPITPRPQTRNQMKSGMDVSVERKLGKPSNKERRFQETEANKVNGTQNTLQMGKGPQRSTKPQQCNSRRGVGKIPLNPGNDDHFLECKRPQRPC